MKTQTITTLLAVFTAALAHVHAHEVWIEDTPGGQLLVRFAEYGDDPEKSPGSLDLLSLPAAFTFGADGKPKTVPSEKKNDHFAIPELSAKDVAHVETAFAVMSRDDKPGRRPIFYARWQPAGGGAVKPSLTFDIVPTGQPGEARITFRGQPLAGAKATAYLPDGSDQELTAGEDGLVRVPVEKPGLYLVACKHQRETQNGFADGRAYDTVSHNASLAWRVPAKTP